MNVSVCIQCFFEGHLDTFSVEKANNNKNKTDSVLYAVWYIHFQLFFLFFPHKWETLQLWWIRASKRYFGGTWDHFLWIFRTYFSLNTAAQQNIRLPITLKMLWRQKNNKYLEKRSHTLSKIQNYIHDHL